MVTSTFSTPEERADSQFFRSMASCLHLRPHASAFFIHSSIPPAGRRPLGSVACALYGKVATPRGEMSSGIRPPDAPSRPPLGRGRLRPWRAGTGVGLLALDPSTARPLPYPSAARADYRSA